MDHQAECDYVVESTFPVAVVALRGVLDGASAGIVHTGLGKALTDRPVAVVVDLAELRCDDPIWLAVFRSVSRRAAEWPGSALLLAGARGRLSELLHAPSQRRTRVYATRAEALRAAQEHPAPPRVRLPLLVNADEPGRARDVTADTLRRWNIPSGLAYSVEVVVSELVTNAVRHARTRSELTLQLSGRYLQVAVRDGSEVPPTAGLPEDDLAPSGRGMHIVNQLAQTWGVHAVADGKVVWAAFRVGSA